MLRLEIIAAPPPRVTELVSGIPEQTDQILAERWRSLRTGVSHLHGRSRGPSTTRSGRTGQPISGQGRPAFQPRLHTYLLGRLRRRVHRRQPGSWTGRVPDLRRRSPCGFSVCIFRRRLLPRWRGGSAAAGGALGHDRGHTGRRGGACLLRQMHVRRVRAAWSRFHARMHLQTVAAAVLLSGVASWTALTIVYRGLFVALFDLTRIRRASVTAVSEAWRPYHLHYANASASLSFRRLSRVSCGFPGRPDARPIRRPGRRCPGRSSRWACS